MAEPKTIDATERRHLVERAKIFWGAFYRCPTTNRIIECLPGDDKAICGCRKSNPNVPTECTERTGVHIVRFLTPATADEYVAQRYPE